ncbi:MAG TPA: hypothetical protein VL486_07820 [Verrucomicrobiae bacterium]|nr:hypothetical protein [Verrucomicrobiae bacterium]
MNRELELFVDRKDDGRLTVSVTPHPTGEKHLVAVRNSLLEETEFPSDVAGTGASAAIVSDPTRAMNSPSDLALLQVQDTLTALHKLAPGYRQLMPQRSPSSPLSALSKSSIPKKLVPFRAAGLGLNAAPDTWQEDDRRPRQSVAPRGHQLTEAQ